MKIKLSIILLLLSISSFSQNETTIDGRSNQLTIKIYGGISPLLSDELMVRTSSMAFFNFKYEDDPGYNVGINVGYCLTNNIALHVGFERKENRIIENLPGNSLLRTKSHLNSNTLYMTSNYYFLPESNLDPYIGLGGAVLQHSKYENVDLPGIEYNGSGDIGLRGLIGVNYNFSSRFALNFETNFTAFGDIDLNYNDRSDYEIEYNPLTINLGIVYRFNLPTGYN